jgi:DNA-binding transcriptional ArsR family regulator
MNFAQQNYLIKTFKLLSNANRVRIISLLAEKKDGLLVNQISEMLSLEQNTTSNHLLRLRENGILQAKQNGTNMTYKIKDLRVVEILNLTKKLA